MTMMETQVLREEIARLSANKCTRRYPADLRGRVIAWARQRLATGAAVDELCRELDMGSPTLRRFLGKAPRAVRGRAGFARLRITRAKQLAAVQESRVMVRGPGGLVVEGLSVDDVARLWERLSCSA